MNSDPHQGKFSNSNFSLCDTYHFIMFIDSLFPQWKWQMGIEMMFVES